MVVHHDVLIGSLATYSVVGRHDGADSLVDALGKGPEIEFVKGSVVYVRVSAFINVPVLLLFSLILFFLFVLFLLLQFQTRAILPMLELYAY